MNADDIQIKYTRNTQNTDRGTSGRVRQTKEVILMQLKMQHSS